MTIEERIALYTPSRETVELLRSTKVILLVGISGAGKDTVKKRLLASPDFSDMVSHTTRLPRENDGILERDGSDYHFVDAPTITTMLEQGAFIEAKYVHGTVYGTSTAELQKTHDNQKIAITDLDVQGVDEYKKLSPDVIAIFILPPDYDTWQQRLAKRYKTPAEFQSEWPKREASAIKELTHALEVPYYHFIINDELDHTVRVASEIAHKPDIFHRKDDEARLAARDLLGAIKSRAA